MQRFETCKWKICNFVQRKACKTSGSPKCNVKKWWMIDQEENYPFPLREMRVSLLITLQTLFTKLHLEEERRTTRFNLQRWRLESEWNGNDKLIPSSLFKMEINWLNYVAQKWQRTDYNLRSEYGIKLCTSICE